MRGVSVVKQHNTAFRHNSMNTPRRTLPRHRSQHTDAT